MYICIVSADEGACAQNVRLCYLYIGSTPTFNILICIHCFTGNDMEEMIELLKQSINIGKPITVLSPYLRRFKKAGRPDISALEISLHDWLAIFGKDGVPIGK